MSLPPAPPSGPASTLPPRAGTARICLFVSAPLSFLTFLASSQVASGTGSRLGLLAAGLVAPVVLILVALRVVADHEPAPLPARRPAAGAAGRWDWTDVVAFLPAAAAAALFFGSLLLGFTQAVDGSLQAQGRSAVESFANQTSAYLAALASLFILLWLRRGLRMPDIGWRLPRPLGRVGWLPWIVIAVIAAAGAYYLSLWLGSLSVQALPNSPNTQCTTVRDQYGGYVAVAIVLVCLIVPFSEETIFRGFLYGWLRRRLPVVPAVVVSAAIFSAAHVVLVLALPLFAVGVVLALLYEYSRSLIPGAIVHGLFNLVGIVMILGATNSC